MFKNTNIFRVIVLIVLTAFTGCVTSKIEYTKSNELPKEKVYRITTLYLKDGSIIDVKEKDAKFKLKDKGIDNVIVYYEDVNIEKSVPSKNIDRLKIEVLESNVFVTVLIIVGSLAIAFLLAIWITLTSGAYTMH
ncbi:MAG: hypothetical protein UZ05_CHB002000520 [Chlorobi bacterium OLB5]|nr:MAG: hypothetical protein UZ05_CHB002000520 [Chlorobi bacterium OLB5]